MSRESAFVDLLRAGTADPAARGLLDDAAVLDIGGTRLVLTKDMLVEGIHYVPDDPPEDIAWKLLAVNLSDLAAKGAKPCAVLLGYMLGQEDWDRAFAGGLQEALANFDVPLIGGDTVSAPAGSARVLSLTAIGDASGSVPSRSGARAGDQLWVSGSIGDAGAGLKMLKGELTKDELLIRRYRRPRPRLEAGQALAPLVSAMMDVSDGLLIDAARIGHASAAGVTVELDAVPLSDAYVAACGAGREGRLQAVTAGDDYELLFTSAPDQAAQLLGLADQLGLPLTRIGRIEPGVELRLTDHGTEVPLPARLGYEHGTS